jgi:diguanylate cyclase (GGDEF)-like protein
LAPSGTASQLATRIAGIVAAMTAAARPDSNPSRLSAAGSAELAGAGQASARTFSPSLEADYTRSRLLANRPLIRAACTLAVLLALLRAIEPLTSGWRGDSQMVTMGMILGTAIVVGAASWHRRFERVYLPIAHVLVPVRSCFTAFGIGQAATHGQPEMLMFLPMLSIGPFFFLGFRFREGLLTVALATLAFFAAIAVYGLALQVWLHAATFVLFSGASCAIAAWYLEKASRRSFLDSRLLAELAQNDSLTSLKNRRMFDEYLERLWQQAVERGESLAVLMIDVDHFKAYNDRYGHQAGDQTLRRVAQTLQTFVYEAHDVLARYGGEEFAVILHRTDAAHASAVAERMRRSVSGLGIAHSDSKAGGVVTISIGIALVVPSRARQPEGAVQLADQALYEAKIHGRNRVELMDQAEHDQLVTGVFAKKSLARG